MTGWNEAKLGAVATLQRGFDLPTRLRRRGLVPIVSSSGVSGWHDRAMVRGPGVITGRYGTIGEVFLEECDFWPLNTTLWVSDFHGNDVRFVYYLLQRVNFAAHSGKSGVPGVNRNDLHAEIVSLPTSTVEQCSVASALGDCDDLISAIGHLIAKKKSIKSGILQQLLTGNACLVGQTKNDWKEYRLGELLRRPPRYGINAAASPIAPGVSTYIRITDIDDSGRFSPHPKVGVRHPKSSDYQIGEGELLFARTGASVGKSYLYDPRDGELVYAGFLINIAPNPDALNPKFLALYAQTKEYWDWVERTSVRSGQPGINAQELSRLPIRLPGIEKQNAIVDAVSVVDDDICKLGIRLAKVKLIKTGIMQQLLTGMLRLPVQGAVS